MTTLQSEKYSTASKIIPTPQKLKNALNSTQWTETSLNGIKMGFLNNLGTKLQFVENDAIFMVANCRRPNTQKLVFAEAEIN